MMSKPLQLKSLQQSRGLAAMAVVAFHLSLLLGNSRYLNEAVFLNFTYRGNLGVDFFFVLSGFIIVFAHHQDINQPQRLQSYLLRRFIRLFPVYWLYTAIFCALVAAGFGSASIVPLNIKEWLSTLLLLRFDNFELPITPAWTLIHELAFYLVFAVLIFNRLLGSVLIVLWLLGCALIFDYAEEGARSALTTYFSPLNFNFIMGMAAFYAFKTYPAVRLRSTFWLGLLAFIVVYGLEYSGIAYAVLQLGYAASFALLILGATSYEKTGFNAGRWKLLSLIGDASYSIYLTHLAFLGLFAKLMIKASHHLPISHGLLFAGVFILTVAAGCLLYWFVERPLLRFCRKLSSHQRA